MTDIQYFYQKENKNYYTIRQTKFGCNSEIIDVASSLKEAKKKITSLNAKFLKISTSNLHLQCNRCHRPMTGSSVYDGTCKCGGLIEGDKNPKEIVICTGCAIKIPKQEAFWLEHTDTYANTNWHCDYCASKCSQNDVEDK